MQIRTGAQVWALRNLLQQDPAAILEQLALSGYKHIEPAGFNPLDQTVQGFTPQQLLKATREQGLTCSSGHLYHDPKTAPLACHAAATLGMKFIVHSYLQDAIEPSIAAYQRAADALNQMGVTARSFGLQLAYHNHAHELAPIEGRIPYQILLEETDPGLVVFQPDLGWMVQAGAHPITYFENYPGRFPIWHIRDIDALTGQSTTIGAGIVAFTSIFEKYQTAGLEYAIVEMASGAPALLPKMVSSFEVVRGYIEAALAS